MNLVLMSRRIDQTTWQMGFVVRFTESRLLFREWSNQTMSYRLVTVESAREDYGMEVSP